jgi:hypothetical protein
MLRRLVIARQQHGTHADALDRLDRVPAQKRLRSGALKARGRAIVIRPTTTLSRLGPMRLGRYSR